MTHSPQIRIVTQLMRRMRRLPDAVLSSATFVVSIMLVAVPAAVWSFSESIREIIEANSYRIESIDRYAAPSNTHANLVGSERRSIMGGTRVKVVFSGERPCGQGLPQMAFTPADMGTLIGTAPPGLLATIRYTRRSTTNAINFTISSGQILFLAMQGDLPTNICFTDKKDQIKIEYAASDPSDISPKERVLIIQTNEPASDIESKPLRERTSAYFAALSLASVCVMVFLVGLLALIIRNGRHDRRSVGEANVKLDKLDSDVSEMKRKHEVVSELNNTVARDLEVVVRDADWIKGRLKNLTASRSARNARDRQTSVWDELKRKGSEDAERRFAEVSEGRRSSGDQTERGMTATQPPTEDPRRQIRELKSNPNDLRAMRGRSR